jgi:exonuclease III
VTAPAHAATLVCWNLAGRVRRLDEQAERVAACHPDLVCLQEVTARTVAPWTAHLRTCGLPHVAVGEAAPAIAARRDRPLLTLTASRGALTVEPVPEVPWPERVLATRVDGLLVVNVHSPISPKPGLAKVRTHEAVHAYASLADAAAVVCGDLNTPRREHPDGRVWTFARTSHGRLRPERGERWDAAERALVHTLRAEHGWLDAYRALHGYGHREASWTFARDRGGWRLDHVLVCGLTPTAAAYAHEWRRAGLSDHSALVVDLDARGGPPGGLS